MIAAAMAYARVGLAVVPVAHDSRGKFRPCTAHGYADATMDPATIAAMWRDNPHANIGIACGPSGLAVLDVDVKGANGFRTITEIQAANGPLPRTWTVRTPSGGAHYYYRAPPHRVPSKVCFQPGVDMRAAGTGVVAPPSRKLGGVYVWEITPRECPLAEGPDWLWSLVDPPAPPRPRTQPIRASSLDRLAQYTAAAINGEARDVAAMAPNTGRNLRLFQASARLGELVGAGLAPETIVVEALETAADDCGLIAEDGRRAVLATIASGLARGIANPREVRQ